MDCSSSFATEMGQSYVPMEHCYSQFGQTQFNLGQSNVPSQQSSEQQQLNVGLSSVPVGQSNVPATPVKPKRSAIKRGTGTKPIKRMVFENEVTIIDNDSVVGESFATTNVEEQPETQQVQWGPSTLEFDMDSVTAIPDDDDIATDMFIVEETVTSSSDEKIDQQESGMYSNTPSGSRSNPFQVNNDDDDKENQHLMFAAPTISEDSMSNHHMITINPNWGRALVVAMDKSSHGDFTQFKLFKRQHSSVCFKRQQNVCLRTVEAEKIILQLGKYVDVANSLIAQDLQPISDSRPMYNDEVHTDAKRCHWYQDVHESAQRMVRVSLTVYNVAQPLVSTYLQIKSFKKDLGGVFRRERYISITLQELIELNLHKKHIAVSMSTYLANFIFKNPFKQF